MTPRTGRPKSEDPRSEVVSIRLTKAEHQAANDAAARAGQGLAAWMRGAITKAAKRTNKPT